MEERRYKARSVCNLELSINTSCCYFCERDQDEFALGAAAFGLLANAFVACTPARHGQIIRFVVNIRAKRSAVEHSCWMLDVCQVEAAQAPTESRQKTEKWPRIYPRRQVG